MQSSLLHRGGGLAAYVGKVDTVGRVVQKILGDVAPVLFPRRCPGGSTQRSD